MNGITCMNMNDINLNNNFNIVQLFQVILLKLCFMHLVESNETR